MHIQNPRPRVILIGHHLLDSLSKIQHFFIPIGHQPLWCWIPRSLARQSVLSNLLSITDPASAVKVHEAASTRVRDVYQITLKSSKKPVIFTGWLRDKIFQKCLDEVRSLTNAYKTTPCPNRRRLQMTDYSTSLLIQSMRTSFNNCHHKKGPHRHSWIPSIRPSTPPNALPLPVIVPPSLTLWMPPR